MASTDRRKYLDKPIKDGHLDTKKYDFNSYDVAERACYGTEIYPYVGIGVVGCMIVS